MRVWGEKVIFAAMLTVVSLLMTVSLSCARSEPGVPAPILTPALGQAPEPTAGSAPSERVPRISLEELLAKMESNADILIVDTRQVSEYDKGHIKGAVSEPLAVIIAGEWVLPGSKEIILYCA